MVIDVRPAGRSTGARLRELVAGYAGASPETLREAVEQRVVEHLDGAELTLECTMTLTITVTGADVVLIGEIDIETAPSLRAELTDLVGITATGEELRVDLGGVSLVDSSGLSVLIAAHKLATAQGVRLVLTALPKHVSRTLSITGLDEILEIA